MGKLTVSQLRQMVAELLNLTPVVERYKSLEKDVKDGMVKLDKLEIEVAGKGRIFVSQYERVTISPDIASNVLGPEIGPRVIVVKESVSNELVNALVKAGLISEELHQELLAKSQRKKAINLHVRPLK